MIEATQKTKHDFFVQQLHRVEPVLLEREYLPGKFEGYTENYTPIKVQFSEDICGRIMPVEIAEVKKDYCVGHIAVTTE